MVQVGTGKEFDIIDRSYENGNVAIADNMPAYAVERNTTLSREDCISLVESLRFK